MSRRKKIEPDEETKETIARNTGSKSGKFMVMAVVLILLAAGIGSAAYFMVNTGHSSAGIDYGNEGGSMESPSGDDSGSGGESSQLSNPVALIRVRSDDGSIDGVIKVELYRDKAPITVDNFIKYANDGFYNGLVFHRIVENFVAQGGGYYYGHDGILTYKNATYPPIKNEANNGLSNVEGTIAMARTSDPNSATSQFYFNLKDNTNLDYNSNNPGYCVFGKVISGWNLVQDMAKIPTHQENAHNPWGDGPMQNVPETHITIVSVTIQD